MSAFAVDVAGAAGSVVVGDPVVVTAGGELVFAATEAPTDSGTTTQPGTPTMRPDLEVTDVSPGLEGFLAIFAVAVVAIFLMLSMTKKLRKVNHSAGADNQASAVFSDRVAPQTQATAGSATEVPGSQKPAASAQEASAPSDGSGSSDSSSSSD